MTRFLNIITQSVGTAGQIFNLVGGVIPPKYQLVVATVIASVQSVVGVIASNYNPDGTKAETAYRPLVK